MSHDSTRSSKCEKIPTSTHVVEGKGESEPEEEFKINTEWSANPTWQTANAPAAAKSSQPKTQRSGRASTMLNDAEAGKCGPLMKAALEKERRRSKHDPSQPRRPLRLLPSEQIERGSTESKAFRKCALENNSFIQLVPNPKQSGKDSWKRYERCKLAATLRERYGTSGWVTRFDSQSRMREESNIYTCRRKPTLHLSATPPTSRFRAAQV